MFIVTNTIQIQTPHAETIIQRFQSSHTKESMTNVTGFLSFELMSRTLPDDPDITELVVLSRWDSEKDQQNWTASNSFKGLHQKKAASTSKSKKESSPVLGNTVARYFTV